MCDHVAQLGPRKWTKIASYLPGRIGKQCRERLLTSHYSRRDLRKVSLCPFEFLHSATPCALGQPRTNSTNSTRRHGPNGTHENADGTLTPRSAGGTITSTHTFAKRHGPPRRTD